jgi:Uma2 family endonuclease
MVTTKRAMTAEDLCALGSDPLYELIDGKLVDACVASTRSSMIAVRIGSELLPFVREHKLGIITSADGSYTLRRNPDTVVMPDVAFIRRERIPAGHDLDLSFPGTPDLAVEVVSPSTTPSGIARKVALYAAVEVPAVWIVYPKQRAVTVHTLGDPPRTLGDDDTLDGAPVLPGLTIAVRDLFREPGIE